MPKGTFPTAQAALASFQKLRATMLSDGKDVAGGLPRPPLIGGNQDIYQWFLIISTHSQRHILQIREIKADAQYPKK